MDFSGSYKLLIFIAEEWKLLTILTLAFVLYFYYTSTFTHFEERGIKFMKPTIILGNLGPRLTARISFHHFQLDIYNKFKGLPYAGLFEGRRPVLYLFDPDLIKSVTIRDFDHFVDRNSFNSNQPGYLKRSLLNLKGKEWKAVRSYLTPSFSSARLRNMLPLMQHCTNQLVEFLKKYDQQDLEMKDAMGHFTLEVIGVCAFGIKGDNMTHENAQFIKLAKNFDKISIQRRMILLAMLMFAPKLLRFMKVSFLNIDTCEKLVDVLKANKLERRKSQIKHNDFLQLVIDAAEKERNDLKAGEKLYLDDDTIDAQSLLFLIAGYETSSTLLSFAIHVLATNPELQERLRENVVAATTGKEMSYELLSEMTFLEGFLMETLRMYPPVSRIDRVCTKQYTLPGTSVVLNPGEMTAIPVYGIHMDSNIYPEPDKFRPERFMDDEKQKRPSHLFLGFGSGPRNCIGLRFAMISAKLSMVELIKNFKFLMCEKTQDPIAFNKRAFLLQAEKGVWVKIETLA